MSDKFVVDANVIISSLINKGVTSKVFELNSKLHRFKFIAPEFLSEEVRKHESKILKLTKLSKEEFDEAYKFLIGQLAFIPSGEFIEFFEQANKISPHEKDALYIALSIAGKCPIFSGDKGLLNSKANVLSPRQLLSILEEE